MKKVILFVVALFFLFSCANDDALNIEKVKEKQTKVENKQDFTIPLKEAIQNLNSTLDIIEQHEQQNANGQQRVAKRNREIANVEVVYNTPKNISSGGMMKAPNGNGEKLLYIVEFKDNQGSAILSADKRIDGEVLAITDFGSILEKQEPKDYEQLFEEYPDFKFYNEELDDYYVGIKGKNLPFAYELCEDYVNSSDWFENEEGEVEPDKNIVYGHYVYPWKVTKKVSPLLTTLWHQGSPFNDKCPKVVWHPLQDKQRAPAGCVPVALAQIMAYHEYPYNLTSNGVKINWKRVKNIPRYDPKSANETDKTAVANLLFNIGGACHTLYTRSFSFTYPKLAKKCMKSYGYSNVKMQLGYSEKRVLNMLDNSNPVFIAAMPKVRFLKFFKDISGGHGWVIDGYIKRERKVEQYAVETGKVAYTFYDNETLVHCNFGWGGLCNGYYYSGIFNLKKGAVETEAGYEYKDSGTADTHYSWAFHTITYDNPNK